MSWFSRNPLRQFSGQARRGVTFQLFVLIIFPLAGVLLLVAFGSLNLHQHAMRTMVGERDERATRAAAAALSEQLHHRAAAMRGLALHAADGPDPEHLLATYTFLQSDFAGGLALYSPQGHLVAASLPHPWWQDRAFIERLAQLTDRDQPLLFSFEAANAETMMATAVSVSGGMVAVGVFSPADLARQTISMTTMGSSGARILLVGDDGRLLYDAGAPLPIREPLSQHPGVAAALRGESGAIYLTQAGQEYVIAYSPVLPVGYALVLEEPWQAVAGPLLQTTQVAPLILAPLLLVTLLALWFGARWIVRPLQQLSHQATGLAQGEFEAIAEPVGGIVEIQRLQTELIHMAGKLKVARQSLRTYVAAITRGQEEERRRLARELHDDTIQALIALNQRIQLAQLSLDGHPAAEKLTEVQQLTAQAIEDVRRFTRDLRPIYLEELGLIPALEALARDSAKTSSLAIEFSASGPVRRLSPEVELALYRMAQEALSNILQHAQARQAQLQLTFTPEEVKLSIEDNGRGFAVPDSVAELALLGHFGLLGLHERAELIGARLVINSTVGRGTKIIVSIRP